MSVFQDCLSSWDILLFLSPALVDGVLSVLPWSSMIWSLHNGQPTGQMTSLTVSRCFAFHFRNSLAQLWIRRSVGGLRCIGWRVTRLDRRILLASSINDFVGRERLSTPQKCHNLKKR
jgi:hypothetical protein